MECNTKDGVDYGEYQREYDLLKKIKSVPAFEYEGVIYQGHEVEATRDFCNNTDYPSDFHVWLQKNYKQLGET